MHSNYFLLNEDDTVWLSTLGTLFTALFMSVEYLHLLSAKKFGPGTLFSWEITGSRPGWLYSGWRIKVLDYIFADKQFRLLILVRILLIVSLVFNRNNHIYLASGLAILFIISCLLNLRHFQGRDGADETLSILLFGLLAYYATDPALKLRWAGPVFIIAQFSLSYFISGYYKLISKTWRSGKAVKEVITTEIYGKPSLYFTVENGLISYICCWAIILWEITFPLIFFMPYPYFLIWLVAGVVFHISTAIIMGLNTFMMAFLTSYPLFYYIITQLLKSF